jgi:hypothetical protein
MKEGVRRTRWSAAPCAVEGRSAIAVECTDPLAREVVLVRGGYRTPARGPPDICGSQHRGRGGRPVAGLQLLDCLPHGVRGAPDQPCGRAAGRASGLERGCSARFADRPIAASCHPDCGAARSRLAPAPLFPGRGRHSTVPLGGRSRDDDGSRPPLVHVPKACCRPPQA